MKRRVDYITAEKISLALLTRAAFGTEAGLTSAQRLGVGDLAENIFQRVPIETRIEIAGVRASLDRRRPWPRTSASTDPADVGDLQSQAQARLN
jgi:hypothetical protein